VVREAVVLRALIYTATEHLRIVRPAKAEVRPSSDPFDKTKPLVSTVMKMRMKNAHHFETFRALAAYHV
jgi:hypothetical protein